MTELSVVGKSVTRIDALEKATGKAVFCSDIMFQNMLHAKVLRSPYPHAKIINIDTSKARALPGVRCVLTGADAPRRWHGSTSYDEPVLAQDVVRYAGEPVVAVAADTEDIAEAALELIRVEYQELPAVFDTEEAWSTNPPVVVHPNLKNYVKGRLFGGPRLDPNRPNVFFHYKIRHGDVEKGFAEADMIIENRFTTSRVQHVPLEPMVAIGHKQPDGSLIMWVGRNYIWKVRQDASWTFDMKPSKIRCIEGYVGGSFGCKGLAINEELITVFLALHCDRPVKHVFTRQEVFLHGGNKPPFVFHIKDGVKKDGSIVAREIRAIINGGGYESNADIVTRNAAFGAASTYRIPNFKWDSYGVYTNNPPGCAFRGFGSENCAWAVESQTDIIAEKVGIDPVELRRKHLLKEGDINVSGEITHSTGARECLDKVVQFINARNTKVGSPWQVGKGIGIGNKYSLAPTSAMATIKILEDETISVYHSVDEVGQGCNTVAAQMVAEEFDVPVENVKVVFADTLNCPHSDGGSTSSRVTYNLGNAIIRACNDAKSKVFAQAANKLNASAEELDTRGGKVFVKNNPEQNIGISSLFHGYRGSEPGDYGFYTSGGEIIGTGIWVQDYAPEDLETGQANPKLVRQGKSLNTSYCHTAKAVEVAVNVETGQVKLLSGVAAHDMGTPINPKMCEQQADGGFCMGIGDALFEEMKMDRGIVTNPNFTDYIVPSPTEMPANKDFASFNVWVPHRTGPYGAKAGFGEGVLVGVEPAIANAIYNALGVRIHDLPITPMKILKALKEKSGK